MSTPAIVLKSEFVYGTKSRKFTGYLRYINRDNAKESPDHKELEFKEYLHYMGDYNKEGSLFNGQHDLIEGKNLNVLNDLFGQAEKSGSPMWKDIISFDNEWLAKQALYDPETNFLNESKMKNAVRQAIDTMCKREGLQMPVWSASFHYNTDNIHVHIATVDLDPSDLPLAQAKDTRKNKLLYDDYNQPIMQYRGKRKPKTLDKMKSTVISHLVDRSKTYKRIDELIRDNARRIRDIKVHKDVKNDQLQNLFDHALKRMPRDKKMWRYDYHKIDEARPYIDKIGEHLINTYFKDEFVKLHEKLDAQVELNRELYGESDRHDGYKANKLDDFYKRMGNAVINVLKDYEKVEIDISLQSHKPKNNYIRNDSYHYDFKAFSNISREFNQIIRTLRKVGHKTFHDYQTERNIAEYDRMMSELER